MKDLISPQTWNSIFRCSSWCVPLFLVGLKFLPKKSARNSRWVFYLLCCDGASGYVLPPEACLSSGEGLGWHHWEALWWPLSSAPGLCKLEDTRSSTGLAVSANLFENRWPKISGHISCVESQLQKSSTDRSPFFSWVLAPVWMFSSETNFHPKQWDAARATSTRHAGPWAAGYARVVLPWQKNWGSGFLTAGWSAQVLFLGKPSRSVAKMKGFPHKNAYFFCPGDLFAQGLSCSFKDEESQPWGFQQKQHLEMIVGPQFG